MKGTLDQTFWVKVPFIRSVFEATAPSLNARRQQAEGAQRQSRVRTEVQR
jgi:hypothetical protein